MPQPFNLTAEINLRGPSNLKLVVGKIRRELGSIKTDLDLKIRPESAKNIALVTSKLKALSKAAVDANADIGKLNTSLSSLAANFSSLSSSTSASVNGVNGVSASVKGAAKNIAATTTEIEEFGKQSGLAVRRFAAFSTVTGVVYGLVNAFSSAFSEFINFNKEIVRLSQVTGKSTDELAGIAKEITRLSTSLGVASSDLLTVSTTLAQAGLSANDTRVALEALAKSALAPSFDDLNETTEGSIAVLRQFGLQANELEGALGSINSVAAAFAVESSDLIAAIQRTGGVFASSSRGVSSGTEALNEFLAVFTSVRQTTRESAETIATGLRTIFTRIQRGQTIEFLKEYNIQLTDLEGKFVGPFEAVRRLSEGLKELDPRDVRFSQIVEELGGFRQIGKVIPLIQQFAVAQDALKVAQKGQGSLAEDARVAQQSLAIQFAKTREEFLSLVRELGDSSTFKSLATITLGLANGLISLTKALEPLLPLLVTFTAIKIGSGLTQYLSGFTKGFGGGGRGGAGTQPVIPTGPIPPGAPTAAGGASATNQVNAITANTAALGSIVQPLTSLLQGINVLNASITQTNALLSSRPQSPRKFATGGFVPGSGNSDTVPAMLTPGEFVIRKSAVNAIGANRLSQMNRYARGGMVSGSRRRRAYVFDFDDTLAESGAIVREGQPDPFIDFRGQKGADFIRSARATRYASMAKKRAAEGYDIHVLTARPGEKQTVSAIQEFMSRNVGSSARSVIGTGGFSGAIGGTASAKSMMLKKLSSLYEQIVFLDDDKENVLAAQQISGVKARLARKNSGGLIQKFALGGMVKDLLDGTWNKRVGAAVLEKGSARSGTDNGIININELIKKVSDKAGLGFDPTQNLRLVKRSDNKGLFTGNLSSIQVLPTYQGLSEQANQVFQSALDNIIVKSVNAATSVVTNRLGLPAAKISQDSTQQFLAGINKGTRGSLFEEILYTISNQNQRLFDNRPDPDAPFDFPNFNSSLFGGEFNELPSKWVDAKASFDTARRDGGLTSKTFTQLRNDIVAGIASRDLDIVASAAGKKSTEQSVSGRSDISAAALRLKYGGRTDIIGYLKSNGFISENTEKKNSYVIEKELPKIIGRNSGGSIPGVSSQDTVPALLTPGEFVINKDSAQRIGYGNLRRMNNVRGYNKGGIVGGVQNFQIGGEVNSVNTLAVVSIFTSILQPQIEKLADSFGKLDKETVSLSSGLSGAIREASSAISSAAIGLGAIGASPRFRNQIIGATGAAGIAGGFASSIGAKGLEVALNENSKQLSKFEKLLQETQQATDPEVRQRASEELQQQFNKLSKTVSNNEPWINFYDRLSSAGNSLLGWNSTIIAVTTSSAALLGAIRAETSARIASAAASVSGAAGEAAGNLLTGAAAAKAMEKLLGGGATKAATGKAAGGIIATLTNLAGRFGPVLKGLTSFGSLLLKLLGPLGWIITGFQVGASIYSFLTSETSKTAEQTAKLGKALIETTKASQQFTNSNRRFATSLLPAYQTLRKQLSGQDLNKAIGSAIIQQPLQAQIDAGTVSKFGDGFINELNPLFRNLVQSSLENVYIQLDNNQSIGDLLKSLKGIRLDVATAEIKKAAERFRKEQFLVAGGTTGVMNEIQAEREYNQLLQKGSDGLEKINNVVEKSVKAQSDTIFQSGLVAAASANLTQSFITLASVISNVGAKLGAITTDFDQGIQNIDDRLNLFSAEPVITPDRTFSRNAAVLQNVQGFSPERVAQVVDQTIGLVASQNIAGPANEDLSRTLKQFRNQILSLQKIQQDVPTFLRNMQETQGRGGERELIIRDFEKLFENLDIDTTTREKLIKDLDDLLRQTGGSGNKTVTLETLLANEGISKAFELSGKSAELGAAINEKYNSVVEKLASKATELSKTFGNLNKLAVEQIKLRAETDINISKILGEEISTVKLNELFDKEISTITGGLTDVTDISNRLAALRSSASDLINQNQQNTEAYQTTVNEITRLNDGLNAIISSGTKLKNAFDNLEKKEKRLFSGPRDLARRLIENPLEILKIEEELQALGRVVRRQELPSDFPKAFQATDLLQGLGQDTEGLLSKIFAAAGVSSVAQDRRTVLATEIESINKEREEIDKARAALASADQKRIEILSKSNDLYKSFNDSLGSLFTNEIKARQELIRRLQEQTSASAVNRPTEDNIISEFRRALTDLSQSDLMRQTSTEMRTAADLFAPGNFPVPGPNGTTRVGRFEPISKSLPNPNKINTPAEALDAARKAREALDGARGNSEFLNEMRKTFDGFIQELNKSPTPTRSTGAVDLSFLNRTLDSFVGSFATSITSGLITPVDNIISGLNSVFSDFSTPIATFTRSTKDLLAGLEAFNRTIADLESRGGIKGPNIPQEVSVTVTFDDTVTVVADRNGNKDLLSQIGILVSDTVRRQLNEQNTFGDRRVTTGGGPNIA